MDAIESSIVFFDILKKAILPCEYIITVDTCDKDVCAYCLSRKSSKGPEILLVKTSYDKKAFDLEVQNLAKYFNAEVIR